MTLSCRQDLWVGLQYARACISDLGPDYIKNGQSPRLQQTDKIVLLKTPQLSTILGEGNIGWMVRDVVITNFFSEAYQGRLPLQFKFKYSAVFRIPENYHSSNASRAADEKYKSVSSYVLIYYDSYFEKDQFRLKNLTKSLYRVGVKH